MSEQSIKWFLFGRSSWCGVSAASRLALFPTDGRQNWTRLEYNSKGNNEHGPIKLPQKTTLELAVTYFIVYKLINYVSTLQEINILQNSKPAKFCQQNHTNILASSENNQCFYSIADFFVCFTTLSDRNAPLQEEKSNVSARQIGVRMFGCRWR